MSPARRASSPRPRPAAALAALAAAALLGLAGCGGAAKKPDLVRARVDCGWVEKHIPELRGDARLSDAEQAANDRAISTCATARASGSVNVVYGRPQPRPVASTR